MNYEWDENKQQINLNKHKIDFIDAVYFNWETAQVVEDTRYDYNEQRFIACGFLFEKLVMMVFTVCGENIRVISLRKATKQEHRQYDRET